MFIDGEARAFDIEIARANANGMTDLAAVIEAAKLDVIAKLKEHYGV